MAVLVQEEATPPASVPMHVRRPFKWTQVDGVPISATSALHFIRSVSFRAFKRAFLASIISLSWSNLR